MPFLVLSAVFSVISIVIISKIIISIVLVLYKKTPNKGVHSGGLQPCLQIGFKQTAVTNGLAYSTPIFITVVKK